MTVISRRIVVPQPGASDMAAEQAKKMCDVMNQLGAKARALKVIMGEDSGTIEIFGRYDNFTSGARILGGLGVSPEASSIRARLEVGMACDMLGPYVYRTVYGEPTTQPILVQRMYQIPRAHLQAGIALLPEAKAAFGDKVGMSAVIPVFAPEMDRLIISYYLDSLDELGKTLDDQAMSPAFQNVVNKAAQWGELITARVLAPV